MQPMEPSKKQRGRPVKAEGEKLERRTVFLLPRQWAKIDAAGKEAFGALIDRWKPKAKPQEPEG